MINISLSYGYILKLEIYMERDIKEIRKFYNDLTWKYKETCNYNTDIQNGKRSFSTNYEISKEYYDSYSKELQIRQYEKFLELKALIKECKSQNEGHNYIGHTNGLVHELIRFNPSYDNVSEVLERLKAA